MPDRHERFAIAIMRGITDTAREQLDRDLEAGLILPNASPHERMTYVSGAMAMIAWIDRAADKMTEREGEGA